MMEKEEMQGFGLELNGKYKGTLQVIRVSQEVLLIYTW